MTDEDRAPDDDEDLVSAFAQLAFSRGLPVLEAVVSENVVHEETGRIEARVQLVAASAADAEQWADAFGMTAVANPPPAHLLWTLISAAVGPDDPADLHVWQLVSPEW